MSAPPMGFPAEIQKSVSGDDKRYFFEGQWQIQDFRKKDTSTTEKGTRTYYLAIFSRNYMKMKEIGPKRGRYGGTLP